MSPLPSVFICTYLSFTSDRCDFTHFLLTQRVDDGTLTNVGIADETNTDLLLVIVQLKMEIIVITNDAWSCDVWSCDVWSCDVWSCDVWSCDVWSCDNSSLMVNVRRLW